MVQIPDSFLLGSFVGTVLGLMIYPFVIGPIHQKPEIRIFIPKSIVMYDKTTLEKTENIKIIEEE